MKKRPYGLLARHYDAVASYAPTGMQRGTDAYRLVRSTPMSWLRLTLVLCCMALGACRSSSSGDGRCDSYSALEIVQQCTLETGTAFLYDEEIAQWLHETRITFSHYKAPANLVLVQNLVLRSGRLIERVGPEGSKQYEIRRRSE